MRQENISINVTFDKLCFDVQRCFWNLRLKSNLCDTNIYIDITSWLNWKLLILIRLLICLMVRNLFRSQCKRKEDFFIYHHGYLRFAIFSFQQYYTTLIGHGLHRWVNIDEVCDATCYRKHSSYCNDSTVSHLRRWIRGYFSFFRMIIISSQYSKFKLEQPGKQNYLPLVFVWA